MNVSTRFLSTATGLAFLALAPAAVAEQIEVGVRQTGPDAFEVVATLPATVDPTQAQALLQPVATEACGGRTATFGHYRFESSALVGADPARTTQLFVQQVACGGEPAPAPVPVDLPPTTPADEAAVRQRTLDYLAAKDRDDFDAAAAMMAPGSREMIDTADWRAPRQAFNAEAGEPTRRDVVRVSWYDNPAGAPRAGRYVAADYRGDFEHAGFYCGYAMWFLESDGTYRLIREEEGKVGPGEAAKAAADLPSLRRQLGCRD